MINHDNNPGASRLPSRARPPAPARHPARRDACACLPHTPGHLVSSHVFAPMSACLVCGCPARLPSHASAMCDARPRASVPPRSRLLRACCALPACDLSCMRFPAPCETPAQPQRCVARPPTRRLRDADERGPHFRPRRPCSHLRGARSDQDDQPADRAGSSNAGAHEVTARSHFRAPRTHKGLAPPGQGATRPHISYPDIPVSRTPCGVPYPVLYPGLPTVRTPYSTGATPTAVAPEHPSPYGSRPYTLPAANL